MSKTTVRLLRKFDGLIIKDIADDPKLVPSRAPFMLFHDMFEHINGPEYIGEVWDEFEALGVAFFGRCLGNASKNRYPNFSNIEDIDYIFFEYVYKNPDSIKKSPVNVDGFECGSYMNALSDHINKTINFLTEKRDYIILPEFIPFFIKHFSAGFYKALHKYGQPARLSAFYERVTTVLHGQFYYGSHFFRHFEHQLSDVYDVEYDYDDNHFSMKPVMSDIDISMKGDVVYNPYHFYTTAKTP